MAKEFQFQDLIRENIKKMTAYSSARSDFTEVAEIYIDANENPFNTGCNRYPDPLQQGLKEEIGKIRGISPKRIFLGNGSDEIIDLLMRSICEPKQDNIITFVPSYTMYIVNAKINDLEIRELDLNIDFSIPIDEVKKVMDSNSKILFICTPNNPVGNVVSLDVIEECCQFFRGIVVVDEAYIDFSSTESALQLLDKYPNLLIMQTLSKAYGMAGLRLGMGFMSEEIVAVLNKVKPPYNISGLSQDKALELLRNKENHKQQLHVLKNERERLYVALSEMSIFDNVYPSQANFILTISPYYLDIYNYLVKNKVVARLRDIPPLISCGLRLSVGTPEENTRVLELLQAFKTKK